jgi:hypothetical protein
MRRFSILAACVMAFSLGTLVRMPRAKAQTNSPTQKRMYYQVDYMKTRHGQDPYKLEHDVWGPIHKEMIKNGVITSWSMMQPLYAGAHNYDYITVTGFQSLKDLENADYPAIFNKVWGKDKSQTTMQQTDDTRDMLGSEIYLVTDSIEAPGK